MESVVCFVNDPSAFEAWLRAQAVRLKMGVEVVPLADLTGGWVLETVGMAIVAIKSGFWRFVGVKVTATGANREVRYWTQPLIADPGGEVALILDEAGNLLVRARAEPGQDGVSVENDGVPVLSHVLAGPPAQFSLANLRAHGFAKVPFADKVFGQVPEDPNQAEQRLLPGVVRWKQQIDGGKFWSKSNGLSIVTVDRVSFDQELSARSDMSDFAWIDRVTFRDARKRGLFNDHFIMVTSALV